MKIIFLVSHPIQYFSPLFQRITEEPDIDLVVLYCSKENIKGHFDKGFGVEVKWDIPLLEGYNYIFLKNNSWMPSIFSGFFGLINLSIIRELKRQEGDVLVVSGWNYFTYLLAMLIGKLFRYKVCVRGDNPYNQEVLKNKRLLVFKRYVLGKFLFKLVDIFLYVGKQNKEFYKYYGVPEDKLLFVPHAVDNDKFSKDFIRYKEKKAELKKELGLPADKKIILTVGKYISQKDPMFLLKTFHLLYEENTALVLLGEGALRNGLEEYAKINNLKNVYLTGFKNQNEIGKYYAVADIFVLTSVSEHGDWL